MLRNVLLRTHQLVRPKVLEVFGPTLSDLRVNGGSKRIDWKGRGALDRIAEVFRHVSHSGPLSSGYGDKAVPFMPDFVGSRDLFCFHVCFLLVTTSFTHTFISRTRGRIPHQTARISSFVMGLSMNLLTSAKMSSMSSSVTSGWSSMVQGVSVVPTRVLVRKEQEGTN